jgi:hypothetical protein
VVASVAVKAGMDQGRIAMVGCVVVSRLGSAAALAAGVSVILASSLAIALSPRLRLLRLRCLIPWSRGDGTRLTCGRRCLR